jgi:Type II secretory pathway, component ExeA (predicted ATPase)
MNNQPDKNSKITPLAAFCQRQKISVSQLSDIAGGTANDAGRSTIHRLLRDELNPEYAGKLRRTLAVNLPAFLFSRGLSAEEIDHELLKTFDKGEYSPMINQRTILPRNIQQFFGLTDDPFSKPPSSRAEVFTSPALNDVVDRVIDAIKFQGFVYLTGEIGSGKTTVRALIEDKLSLDPRTKLIFPETFDMNRVTPANISRAILEEFEATHIPNDAVSRAKKVKNVLSRVYQEGMRVAIAFDECHRLNDIALSSLKNFLEMNSGGFQKYLGVVLFGQPSFEARLRDYRFREIVERVTPIQMPDFAASAGDYLAHRLRLVGGNINELFDQEAIDLICRQAKTPLALGNIANSALIISKESFNNRQVIGAAIKTKMHFASAEPKVVGIKKRAV